jgi:hypothetical protein
MRAITPRRVGVETRASAPTQRHFPETVAVTLAEPRKRNIGGRELV